MKQQFLLRILLGIGPMLIGVYFISTGFSNANNTTTNHGWLSAGFALLFSGYLFSYRAFQRLKEFGNLTGEELQKQLLEKLAYLGMLYICCANKQTNHKQITVLQKIYKESTSKEVLYPLISASLSGEKMDKAKNLLNDDIKPLQEGLEQSTKEKLEDIYSRFITEAEIEASSKDEMTSVKNLYAALTLTLPFFLSN